MTVVAVYIGGPLDGQKREEQEAIVTRLVHTASLPSRHPDSPVVYDNARTTYYTKRRFRASDGDVPFVFYAPRDMTDAKMMERLVEYYMPEPEE